MKLVKNLEQISKSCRNIIEDNCFMILKKLPEQELINFYNILSNPGNNNIVSITDLKNKTEPKDIIEEYRIYLKANNKSNSTIKDYINESIKLNQNLINKKISINDLCIATVENYLSMRNSKNISNNTYIKLINCIRSFLKFLFSREYITKDLASFIKIPTKVEPVKEVLSDINIQRIKNYLENRKEKYKFENLRDSIIFYLGIDCGLRRQELINLNWEDINFEESSIKIIKSKGGKSRIVCFNGKLKDLLLSCRRLTGNYSSALIRGIHGKRISKCSLQNIIKRMYKESGIYRKNLTIHSLRHTYAERLRLKGIDIATISKLMGHSSLETTAIYLHVNKDDYKRAVL